MSRALALALACSLLGCAAEVEPLDVHGGEDDGELGTNVEGLALRSLGRGCSTAGTEGISRQLLDEMACSSEGALVQVSHPNVLPTHGRVHLYLSPRGRDMLLSVARTREVRINSALRTIAEQYVLGRGCSVAAAPGRSNHETGKAIDVANYGSVGPALQSAGFSRPLPSRDPVHYVAPGDDLRRLSVLAFQRLWNANNPSDRIAEDGISGPATTSRLARAPAEGFAIGRVCTASPAPAPTPSPTPTPSPGGASCSHSYGGTYGHLACSAGYQCCDGTWRERGSGCGACACEETTGTVGCTTSSPPPPTGASCNHSYGGTYGHLACSAGYQCCDGAWRERGSGCGACACEETTGAVGCTATSPTTPAPPPGASCAHTYGGTYANTACSAGYQCCDGAWRVRGSSTGCGACFCEETTGSVGCGT